MEGELKREGFAVGGVDESEIGKEDDEVTLQLRRLRGSRGLRVGGKG